MNMPKVTEEQVLASIKRETYTLLPDGRTTICQLTLENGFTVNGHSACAHKENYNQADGEKYSRQAAIKEIWPFLGFRLADQTQANQGGDFLTRLLKEKEQMSERIAALSSFLGSPAWVRLHSDYQDMLDEQLEAMRQYNQILARRIQWHHNKRG